MDIPQPSISSAGQQFQHISTSELAGALQRTLNISPQVNEDLQRQQRSNPDAKLDLNAHDHTTYSPSQHYTHSAHIANRLHPLHPAPQDTATRLLIQNNIAPSSLSKAQYALFESADVDQRARLVLLWRLAPPANPLVESEGTLVKHNLASCVTFEQEEQLAWERYQLLMAGKKVEQNAKRQDVRTQDSEIQDEEMV